jgi:NAD(P)-dependent dehydrogenase (short-subunit alcohol dehydrogenase family)
MSGKFMAEGTFVFVTGRRAPELNRAAEMSGPHAVPVLADSSDLDDLDALNEFVGKEAGRIDILLANAGGGSTSAACSRSTPPKRRLGGNRRHGIRTYRIRIRTAPPMPRNRTFPFTLTAMEDD